MVTLMCTKATWEVLVTMARLALRLVIKLVLAQVLTQVLAQVLGQVLALGVAVVFSTSNPLGNLYLSKRCCISP